MSSEGRKRGYRSKSEHKKQSETVTYMQYQTLNQSEEGLGYGNGGETDRWENSLTASEREAVSMYSETYYQTLNMELRAGKEPTRAAMDKELESAINKFDLETPTTFVRGSTADLLGGEDTVDGINARIGEIVVDKGYTSSSATAGEAFTYKPVIYHIDAPSGKGIGAYIRGISSYGIDENEFLFNKGGMYRIKGAYTKSGIYDDELHVNIEWVGRVG